MSVPQQPQYISLALALGIPDIEIEERLYQLRNELRVCVPAVVVSFDATTQLATVQIAVQETVFQNLIPTPVSIQPLPQVQVGMFRAGGFSLTFPVQAGDEGIVIFNDNCINSWKKSGGTKNAQEEWRRHDLSDGMFLPLVWSQPRKLSSYSNTFPQLRNDAGTIMLEFTPTGLKVVGDLEVTGTLTANGIATLDGKNFITHIHSGVTTGGGDTGPPV